MVFTSPPVLQLSRVMMDNLEPAFVRNQKEMRRAIYF
jgi:hypothetical protein